MTDAKAASQVAKAVESLRAAAGVHKRSAAAQRRAAREAKAAEAAHRRKARELLAEADRLERLGRELERLGIRVSVQPTKPKEAKPDGKREGS